MSVWFSHHAYVRARCTRPLRPLCAVLRNGSSLECCLDGGGAGSKVHTLAFVRKWQVLRWWMAHPGASFGWEPGGCKWRFEAGASCAHTLRVPLHAAFGTLAQKGIWH